MYRVIRTDDVSLEELVRHFQDELVLAVEMKAGLKVSMPRVREVISDALRGDGHVILQVGHCFCLASVAESWYSKDKYLYEELLVANGTGDFHEVAAGIQDYAKDQGCKAVVIGTLAQRRERAYGRLLESCGFRQVAQTYIKELHHG